MVDVRQATEELLRANPHLHEPLQQVVDVDRTHDVWEFGDLPLDSGEFGEIVSTGIVEGIDDGYRLVDRDAVTDTLHGRDRTSPRGDPVATFARWLPSVRPSWNVTTTATLVGALTFLFLLRVLQYPSVFRDEHVVSPANDPYFYRYWTDQLLAISTDPRSLEVIANLPAGAARTRPFAHAANWWITAVLGGDQWAADMTAAWLPVVASLLLGLVICWTATVLTGDLRVGIASIFVFALSPVHAIYGGLGFLEHRLHQYLWLGVTVLALTWLAADLARRRALGSPEYLGDHLRSPRTWLAAGSLGVGLALSILAWGGSIMMCFALAGYLGVRSVIDTRAGVSPTVANLPVVGGIAGAVALTAWCHFRWGWHEPFVVYVPAFLLLASIVLFLVGDLFRVGNYPLAAFGALQVSGAVLGIYGFRWQFPLVWARLVDRADDLLYRESAIETTSLFAEEWGGLLAPLLQNGVDFMIGLAVLAWAWLVVWRGYRPAVAVLCSYVSVWLVLAAVQIRFAAQLWVVLSVLGGFGVVWLLSWMDLARNVSITGRTSPPQMREPGIDSTDPPIARPTDMRMIATLGVVLLLISSLSLIFVPTAVVETTYDDDQYAALQAMEAHSSSIPDLDHDRFVLSNWGHNRMYNYFMHGDASSYGYARSNYFGFIADSDPDGWFDRFEGRVGYLVVDDVDGRPPDDSIQSLLGEHLDAESSSLPAVAHYRAIHLGETANAFVVVPGATIETGAANGSTLTANTTIELRGRSYTYERPFVHATNDSVSATVAYPGEYDVNGTQVTVSQAAVLTGQTLEAVDRSEE